MNTKSEPIGQHYLPVSYLEGFGDESSMVWMFDKKTEKMARVHPIAITKINYFYSYRTEDGQRNNEIETMLGEIEGITKPIIEKLEGKKLPTPEEKETLACFITFLWARGPSFQTMADKVRERNDRDLLQRSFANVEVASKSIKEYELHTGDKFGLDVEKAVEFFSSPSRFKLKYPRESSLIFMLQFFGNMVEPLLNMDWQFYYSQKETAFITCDNPFNVIVPLEYPSSNLFSKDVVKMVPLSKRINLAIKDPGLHIRFGSLDRKLVREQNVHIAGNAKRFIIGHSDNQLMDILERLKTSSCPPPKVVTDEL